MSNKIKRIQELFIYESNKKQNTLNNENDFLKSIVSKNKPSLSKLSDKKTLIEYELLKPSSFNDNDDSLNNEDNLDFSLDELKEEDEPQVKDKIEKISSPQQPLQKEPIEQKPAIDDEAKNSILDIANKSNEIMNMVNDLSNKIDLFHNKVSKIEVVVDSMKEPTEQEKFDNIKKVSGAFNTRIGDYFNTNKMDINNLETKVSDIPYMYGKHEIEQSFKTKEYKFPPLNENKKTKKK